ncbi:SRPBCC family protein [Thalassoroseus pseudoceratinae]|uniref:SRPBCC family protein n=1 Tax=Thalassoroseus pseudoceratinae TaxID=2713176 RepID=UPI001424604C|nr:SRPBCC family protein [Thalassoroseus pseudoceratinae]
MAEFEYSSSISCEAAKLFEFIIRPHDAYTLSPPKMNITLLQTPEVISLGSVIRFQVEAFGMTQEFTHEVIAFDPGQRFVEQQTAGLFKKYVHEHTVTPTEDGVTLRDRVEFEPPGGMVGFMLTEDRIRENLQKSLEYSHGELKKQMETA